MIKNFISVISLVALTAATAHAQTKAWTAGSSDWFNFFNWSPIGLPTSSDTAIIQNGGAASITAPDAAAGALRVGDGGNGSVFITSAGTLATNESVIGSSSSPAAATGFVTVRGSWINQSGFSLAAAGEASSGTVNLDAGGVIQTPNVVCGSGTGTFAFNGGTLRLSGKQAGLFTGFKTGDITLGSSHGVIDTQEFDVASNAIFSGTGGLTKQGAGMLTLTANHGYSGATIISAGTLRLGDGGATGSVSGNLVNNAALIFNRFNSFTYGAVISGSGSVNKLGPERLTLTGDNTHSGGTTVSAGTLRVNGAIGAATVQSAAVLEGTGSVGAVLLANGSTLSPGTGAAAGTLTCTSITAGSKSSFFTSHHVISNSDASRLLVTGTANFSLATLSLSFLSAPAAGVPIVLIEKQGAGTITPFPGIAEGQVITYGTVLLHHSYIGGDGNDFTVTAVTAPVVSVVAEPGSPPEGVNRKFNVTLSASSGLPVTLDYASADGTAKAPGDYTPVSGQLVIPAGTLTGSIFVQTIDDEISEYAETIQMIVSNPINATLGTATATGFISDNDPLPVFSVTPDQTVSEEVGTVTFIASIDRPSERTPSFTAALIAGTANAADFSGSGFSGPTAFSFAPGVSSTNIVVNIADDALNEDTETFALRFSNPSHLAPFDPFDRTVTILDNDPLPLVQVLNTLGVTEGANIPLAVQVSPISGREVQVNYTTVDGSAVSPADYIAASGTFVIPPFTQFASVPVVTIDDNVHEATEFLQFRISNPVNATLGPQSTASASILNNDPAPVLTVTAPGPEVQENAGRIDFLLTLDRPSQLTPRVNFAFSPGTAAHPDDFTGTMTGQVAFGDGVISRTVTLDIVQDRLIEGDESFAWQFSNHDSATLAFPGVSGMITIVDDDFPPIALSDMAIDSGDSTTPPSFSGKVTWGPASGIVVAEVSSDLGETDPWQPFATIELDSAGSAVFANLPVPSERIGAKRLFFRIRVASGLEGFVLIPAGNFTMGRTSGDIDSDAPPVNVYVSEFYMATHEVTKALWDEVRTWGLNNGYTDLSAGGGKAADHPVHSVLWRDVVKWCNARSERDGLTPVYRVGGNVMRTGTTAPVANWNANGYRLPSEAEWEKAARGGVAGQRFPWGDTISHSQANYIVYSVDGTTNYYNYDVTPRPAGSVIFHHHPTYNDGASPYTSPVGSFVSNGYGLYDMSGNVWEWCWDLYSASSYRVLRGGSWYNNASSCRTAYRGSGDPILSNNGIGFRPARSSVP